MRTTTKAVQEALDAARADDARKATRLDVLAEWVKNTARHVHERREAAIANENHHADTLLGELENFHKELEVISGELRGALTVKAEGTVDESARLPAFTTKDPIGTMDPTGVAMPGLSRRTA